MRSKLVSKALLTGSSHLVHKSIRIKWLFCRRLNGKAEVGNLGPFHGNLFLWPPGRFSLARLRPALPTSGSKVLVLIQALRSEPAPTGSAAETAPAFSAADRRVRGVSKLNCLILYSRAL